MTASAVREAERQTADQLQGLRAPLVVLIVLLSWIGVSPFPDLTQDTLLDADRSASSINIVAYVALGGVALALLLATRATLARSLLGPIPLLAMGWLAVTSVISQDPGLSLRRLGLAYIVLLMACCVAVLPRTLAQFTKILAGCALVVIALCYLGVLIAPQFAVHQARDVAEPLLAGNWRGLFAHKNDAAQMMVIFIFVGILAWRVVEPVLGAVIIVAATFFLWKAAGKTSLGLLPLTLVLAAWFVQSRSRLLQIAIAVVPLLVLNVGTVGSVELPWVEKIDQVILPDATFTGRTEIWRFAFLKLAQRPLLGYGFQAFWQTSETRYGTAEWSEPDGSEQPNPTEAAVWADHAHNGYLDVALTTGLPGLAFTLAWLVGLPLYAFSRAKDNGAPPALLLFYAQIWLFCIYFASLESVYYNRTSPTWLLLQAVVLGITALMRYRTVD